MKITFIRKSDNKKFTFEKGGDSPFILNPKTKVLPAPEIESATYNYAGIDGGYAPNINNKDLKPLQLRRPRAFDVLGWILPNINLGQNVSLLEAELNEFFKIREYYQVVYEKCSENDFYVENVIITDGPYTEYNIGGGEERLAGVEISLLALDPMMYKAMFDGDGNLVPTGNLFVPKTITTSGGRVWSASGAVWQAQNGGKKWTLGSQGVIKVLVDSTDNVYPIITIRGQAVNPTITDITTNTSLSYSGTVASGQTLVLDCANKTAKLNGTSVVQNVSGNWLYLVGGMNKFEFNAGGDTTGAELEWSETVG